MVEAMLDSLFQPDGGAAGFSPGGTRRSTRHLRPMHLLTNFIACMRARPKKHRLARACTCILNLVLLKLVPRHRRWPSSQQLVVIFIYMCQGLGPQDKLSIPHCHSAQDAKIGTIY